MFIISTTFCVYSFDFDGTITAYGGGNDDNLNTVKAGAGTIYIQDGTGNSLMNRLWIIGDTESSVQKQTHTLISGTTSDDFYYNVLSLKGRKKLIVSFRSITKKHFGVTSDKFNDKIL